MSDFESRVIELLEQILKNTTKQPRKLNKEPEQWQYDVFEGYWGKYPKKQGKKEAFKHFCATVRSNDDKALISAAFHNYLNYLKQYTVEEKYIQKGSTFFNNWKDWLRPDLRDDIWDLKKPPTPGMKTLYGDVVSHSSPDSQFVYMVSGAIYEWRGNKYVYREG